MRSCPSHPEGGGTWIPRSRVCVERRERVVKGREIRQTLSNPEIGNGILVLKTAPKVSRGSGGTEFVYRPELQAGGAGTRRVLSPAPWQIWSRLRHLAERAQAPHLPPAALRCLGVPHSPWARRIGLQGSSGRDPDLPTFPSHFQYRVSAVTRRSVRSPADRSKKTRAWGQSWVVGLGSLRPAGNLEAVAGRPWLARSALRAAPPELLHRPAPTLLAVWTLSQRVATAPGPAPVRRGCEALLLLVG